MKTMLFQPSGAAGAKSVDWVCTLHVAVGPVTTGIDNPMERTLPTFCENTGLLYENAFVLPGARQVRRLEEDP
jgi:hypothetical protein